MNIIATLLNFGGTDLIIILVVVLIIFGPKKLPELARGLRQAMDEFNKAKHEVERELTTPSVAVQPAPGQQPRQLVEAPLPPPPAPVVQAAPAPVAYAAPVGRAADEQLFSAGDTFQHTASSAQAARPVEDTHPAGQA
jgi:sec-independent protein translocase protein TatA